MKKAHMNITKYIATLTVIVGMLSLATNTFAAKTHTATMGENHHILPNIRLQSPAEIRTNARLAMHRLQQQVKRWRGSKASHSLDTSVPPSSLSSMGQDLISNPTSSINVADQEHTGRQVLNAKFNKKKANEVGNASKKLQNAARAYSDALNQLPRSKKKAILALPVAKRPSLSEVQAMPKK